jgi:hypothetical protein
MWKIFSELTKENMADFRNFKKAKIYADEDIEDGVVEYLRGKGVNINSARELLRHRGKPDSFHATFSLKKKFRRASTARHQSPFKKTAGRARPTER